MDLIGIVFIYGIVAPIAAVIGAVRRMFGWRPE